MRVEPSVTALSWLPSEAIDGMTQFPFEWATLWAVTPARVAEAAAHQIDVEALTELTRRHRREEAVSAP